MVFMSLQLIQIYLTFMELAASSI
uniref:Uncharacterized protein n=1 Tax=Rhizophora mucronata TaxID=61149 RepID=A0A2P2P5Q8_RHIMU